MLSFSLPTSFTFVPLFTNPMALLSDKELRTVVSVLAQKLDSLGIDYAIMGGAAICLLRPSHARKTEDVDLVLHVDHRMIDAEALTALLITTFPSEFEGVSQFGHMIPAFKLARPGETAQLNLETATRTTRNINGQAVKIFSAEWILREKILSQYQRQGSEKERMDFRDLIRMIPLAEPNTPELDFNENPEMRGALANLLQKRPELAQTLKTIIKCNALFGN
ncbi:unnamed protein product [Penicillium salamii]|nr:unnamed protein product [Penicillium salamii]